MEQGRVRYETLTEDKMLVIVLLKTFIYWLFIGEDIVLGIIYSVFIYILRSVSILSFYYVYEYRYAYLTYGFLQWDVIGNSENVPDSDFQSWSELVGHNKMIKN